MALPRCWSCRQPVLPKADGTCPGCGQPVTDAALDLCPVDDLFPGMGLASAEEIDRRIDELLVAGRPARLVERSLVLHLRRTPRAAADQVDRVARARIAAEASERAAAERRQAEAPSKGHLGRVLAGFGMVVLGIFLTASSRGRIYYGLVAVGAIWMIREIRRQQ